jgi:hypothetical protein
MRERLISLSSACPRVVKGQEVRLSVLRCPFGSSL